jgi:hypothetical protein
MDNNWPGMELDVIKELRKADYDDFLIFEVEFCADNNGFAMCRCEARAMDI